MNLRPPRRTPLFQARDARDACCARNDRRSVREVESHEAFARPSPERRDTRGESHTARDGARASLSRSRHAQPRARRPRQVMTPSEERKNARAATPSAERVFSLSLSQRSLLVRASTAACTATRSALPAHPDGLGLRRRLARNRAVIMPTSALFETAIDIMRARTDPVPARGAAAAAATACQLALIGGVDAPETDADGAAAPDGGSPPPPPPPPMSPPRTRASAGTRPRGACSRTTTACSAAWRGAAAAARR